MVQRGMRLGGGVFVISLAAVVQTAVPPLVSPGRPSDAGCPSIAIPPGVADYQHFVARATKKSEEAIRNMADQINFASSGFPLSEDVGSILLPFPKRRRLAPNQKWQHENVHTREELAAKCKAGQATVLVATGKNIDGLGTQMLEFMEGVAVAHAAGCTVVYNVHQAFQDNCVLARSRKVDRGTTYCHRLKSATADGASGPDYYRQKGWILKREETLFAEIEWRKGMWCYALPFEPFGQIAQGVVLAGHKMRQSIPAGTNVIKQSENLFPKGNVGAMRAALTNMSSAFLDPLRGESDWDCNYDPEHFHIAVHLRRGDLNWLFDPGLTKTGFMKIMQDANSMSHIVAVLESVLNALEHDVLGTRIPTISVHTESVHLPSTGCNDVLELKGIVFANNGKLEWPSKSTLASKRHQESWVGGDGGSESSNIDAGVPFRVGRFSGSTHPAMKRVRIYLNTNPIYSVKCLGEANIMVGAMSKFSSIAALLGQNAVTLMPMESDLGWFKQTSFEHSIARGSNNAPLYFHYTGQGQINEEASFKTRLRELNGG